MRLLAHPFDLWPNGAARTVEQDSEESDGELIAVLALTRLGERPLAPAFGLRDPAWGGFPATELAAQLGTYGPPVVILDIVTTADPDRQDVQLAEVTFE